MTRMQLAFTHELPVPMRRAVYTAIVEAPRILDHKWYFPGPGDTYYGCALVVAAFAAVNEAISKTKIEAMLSRSNAAAELGEMLGMTGETVQACVLEWDTMEPKQRDAFVVYIGKLLANLPPEDGGRGLGAIVSAVPANVRRALATVSFAFAFLLYSGA